MVRIKFHTKWINGWICVWICVFYLCVYVWLCARILNDEVKGMEQINNNKMASCFDSSEITFEIYRFLLLVVNVKIALWIFDWKIVRWRFKANISIIWTQNRNWNIIQAYKIIIYLDQIIKLLFLIMVTLNFRFRKKYWLNNTLYIRWKNRVSLPE